MTEYGLEILEWDAEEEDKKPYYNFLKLMKDELENKRKEFEDKYNPNPNSGKKDSGKKDSIHTYIPIISKKRSEELPKSLCPINFYDDKSELRKKFHISFGFKNDDIENYYNYKSTLDLDESEINSEKAKYQPPLAIPFFEQLRSNRDRNEFSRKSFRLFFNNEY